MARDRISPGLAIALVTVGFALSIATWAVVYPSAAFAAVVRAGRGTLTPTTITMGAELIALLVILRWRGVAPRDVGLDARALIAAVIPAVLVWGLAVAVLQVVAAWSALPDHPGGDPAADVVAQFVANAPAEELLFRAVLITALVAWAERRGARTMTARATAVVIAALVCALVHVPRSIALDMTAEAAAGYALGVALFAAALGVAYVATGNLWFCVLVHALGNVRPSPWPAPQPLLDPYALIAVVVAIAWATARARRRSRHAQASR